MAIILISLSFYFVNSINKENARQNEQIKADILQGNAPPVIVHGNCINGKVYFLDDIQTPHAIVVGNGEPLECK